MVRPLPCTQLRTPGALLGLVAASAVQRRRVCPLASSVPVRMGAFGAFGHSRHEVARRRRRVCPLASSVPVRVGALSAELAAQGRDIAGPQRFGRLAHFCSRVRGRRAQCWRLRRGGAAGCLGSPQHPPSNGVGCARWRRVCLSEWALSARLGTVGTKWRAGSGAWPTSVHVSVEFSAGTDEAQRLRGAHSAASEFRRSYARARREPAGFKCSAWTAGTAKARHLCAGPSSSGDADQLWL